MRYIGCKSALSQEIEKIIYENTSNVEKVFCDIFSGTATVARHFKKDYEIISNDLMHFSYIIQMASIGIDSPPLFLELEKVIKKDPFSYFRETDISLESVLNFPFIYKTYSPNEESNRQYFSSENAIRIDFIRQTIESWKERNLLDYNEYYYLLACLIEAVPFVSNTAGTYGAYLKHWDKRAGKTLEIIKLKTITNYKNNECFNEDANQLIKRISGDILYIDPPYNSRQYSSNYHVLETISRYDNPQVKGKTGMRPCQDIKSAYCAKQKSLTAFDSLIKNANFNHIIVSYSTEGIMGVKSIEETLKKYGNSKTYKIKKIPYRRYKRTAQPVENNLYECLFYIRKD